MWEKKEMDGQYVRRSIDRLLVQKERSCGCRDLKTETVS